MKKVILLSLVAISIVSCGGDDEKEEEGKELSFCECHKLMEERESEVANAEDRDAAVEKWREKTKKCNEISMKATQDGTYDQQLEDCK